VNRGSKTLEVYGDCRIEQNTSYYSDGHTEVLIYGYIDGNRLVTGDVRQTSILDSEIRVTVNWSACGAQPPVFAREMASLLSKVTTHVIAVAEEFGIRVDG
jgi:hypothetical protein